MENNAKPGSGAAKINNQSQEGEDRRGDEENPNVAEPERLFSARTPFSDLSQVDADLALARTLQEQERAYMMLRMSSAVEGSHYGIWEGGGYMHDEGDFDDHHDEGDSDDDDDDEEEEEDDEADEDEDEDDEENEYNASDEDTFDVHAHDEEDGDHNSSAELEAADFSSDEAYARALQDAEEREMAARLMFLTGINGHNSENSEEEHGSNAQQAYPHNLQLMHYRVGQDAWEEIDPDELSYEELIALGEVVGTESRGLSADTISSLPSVNYKAGSNQNGSNDSCVICRLDYEDDEKLILLSCKHSYHSECINNWLQINKVCPVCSAEVSTSGNS